MPDDPYTLADLGRLAGVTPRTVRYYVAQGLLPSPEAAGPATRYAEGHLARLRLIKRLQRDHLPLAEIRVRLDRLDDATITALLAVADPAEAEPSTSPQDTLAFVRDLMARTGVAPRTTLQTAAAYRAPSEPMAGLRITKEDVLAPAPPPARLATAPATESVRLTTAGGTDRSTWDRLAITPDVEIHVRRPLDRRSNKRVDQLLKIARELFDEEP